MEDVKNYIKYSLEELAKIYKGCIESEKALKAMSKVNRNMAEVANKMAASTKSESEVILLAGRMKKKNWLFEFEGEDNG